MANKALRRGKLHGRYQTLSKHWHGGRNVPWLNVRGLWLEEAGFNVGDPIDIIVGKGKLIVKKAYDGNSSH
ncbi:SymE family type I addiction module toxin [Chitinophaga ginsengisoli]|uniref:Toxic protein SymE n=1 Tax=Chitinophaga ginsengisoli TaxID=363837 RepID=A0A2P8F7U2_9BACT|nr:SymE family type I addiction module toxin [Chitinophaga ginsengisoli]PSL17789.1 toxic protein SymE [Chitinophaga ginsengisoli]